MPDELKRPSSSPATAACARTGSRSARTMWSKKSRRRAMAAVAAPTPPAPRTRMRMGRGSLPARQRVILRIGDLPRGERQPVREVVHGGDLDHVPRVVLGEPGGAQRLEVLFRVLD